MAAKFIIHKKNDQYIEVSGLTKAVDGTYENNATATAKIVDAAGATVLDTFPLAYVAASDGIYRGSIPASFDPPAAVGYKSIIEITGTDTLFAHLEIPTEVRVRAS